MQPASSDLEPGTEDATRRTHLANERTYLAWWRTGLTALAVSVGAGRLIPELTGGPAWPLVLLGAAFALVGAAFVAYGLRRHRAVTRALTRGEFAPAADGALLAFTAVGLALAIGALLVVVLG